MVQNWALAHLSTCKAAANRSNVHVSGKNNKILLIPQTMQGILTRGESKGERKKHKNKNKNQHEMEINFDQDIKLFWHFSGD